MQRGADLMRGTMWLRCKQTCRVLAAVLVFGLVKGVVGAATSSPVVNQLSPCSALVNGALINLKPLAKLTAPRLSTVYLNWTYTFNPCEPFDQLDNPYKTYGDQCLSVALCKYSKEKKYKFYYTLGFQQGAKFLAVQQDVTANRSLMDVKLVFQGYQSHRNKKTYVSLICDRSRTKFEDALFKITKDKGPGDIEAELHHLCCCLDGCPDAAQTLNRTRTTPALSEDVSSSVNNSSVVPTVPADSKKVIVIIAVNMGVLMLAGLAGLLCYNKRTYLSKRIYHKVPVARHPPEPTNYQLARINTSQPVGLDSSAMERGSTMEIPSKAGYRDYQHQPSRSKSKSLNVPILEDCEIPLSCVQLGQRLGSSILGDTYVGESSGIKVAVKRITLSVHENQHSVNNMKWIQDEVWFLSRQRHRNIVSMLGICTEPNHPYIVSQFISGQSVKDFISHSGGKVTWPHRVKILSQVADGMAFLHSTSPPILHRDLRCGNMFITDNDVIKVADFGIVKLTQPMRSLCHAEDCCCQGQYSACPPSIAWTAPEVLEHPNSEESEGHITTASDVYSFAIVMWELAMCEDPFDEIATTQEVIELVLSGGRPEIHMPENVMPLYQDLMKRCWHASRETRPNFKQITVHLKEVLHQAKAFQKHINSNQKSHGRVPV